MSVNAHLLTTMMAKRAAPTNKAFIHNEFIRLKLDAPNFESVECQGNLIE